jgi:hypothetical protein
VSRTKQLRHGRSTAATRDLINGPKCADCQHHQFPAHKPLMVHGFKQRDGRKVTVVTLMPALELSTGCRERGCACRAFRLEK